MANLNGKTVDYISVYNNFAAFFVAHDLTPDKWYHDANKWCARVAAEFDLTVDLVAAVVAVMSPLTGWEKNSAIAYDIIKAHSVGENTADKSVKESGRYFGGGFDANRIKAHNMLSRGRVVFDKNHLSGQKVESFFHNIVNPNGTDRVTIDVWMIRVALDDMSIGIKEAALTPKMYDAISRALIDYSATLDAAPLQVQAAIWEKVRKLSKLSRKRRKATR